MTYKARQMSPVDHWISFLDNSLRTLTNNPQVTNRDNPAQDIQEAELTEAEKKHVAGLMRVNHCGEVCAQGLYQGQALTAKQDSIRQAMHQSAQEENDHLAWTEQRLKQLESHTSIFNPLFYAGSVAIGAAAGIAGDKWSLGFVAETEKQVENHLQEHLAQLPEQDQVSKTIIETMQQDEIEHAEKAIHAGAAELPTPIKKLMKMSSKLMTRSTYHL
jgi:3-demethoxyubiquinol 3-hydroxylase